MQGKKVYLVEGKVEVTCGKREIFLPIKDFDPCLTRENYSLVFF